MQLSFIGGDGFPDKGFAKKHLLSATYSNKIEGSSGPDAIRILSHDTATAMGNVCLIEVVEDIETSVVVDKVFVYRKVGAELKLMVHMSALRNERANKLSSDDGAGGRTRTDMSLTNARF